MYVTVQVHGGSSRNGLLKSQVLRVVFLPIDTGRLSVEQMRMLHNLLCCFVNASDRIFGTVHSF